MKVILLILTVTLNPSVDIRYSLEHFSLNTVNRVRDVSKTAGGKGLNVTRVLRQLGNDVTATGFLGGSLGDFIRSEITGLDVHDAFVQISGDTRNCIAVIHDGCQTEILESGPEILAKEQDAFLHQFVKVIPDVNLVTISGSLPKGITEDFYGKLLELASEKRVLLDTKGELLKHSLRANQKPYLIKPNEHELSDLLGIQLTNEEELMDAIQSPLFEGISWVVVTLGEDGALVRHHNHIYRVHIPKVDAVNPVGSGDSVIAGFASGIALSLSDEELLKYGLSMGVLNAMEEKTGHINPERIDWCMENIRVEK